MTICAVIALAAAMMAIYFLSKTKTIVWLATTAQHG
jgi:hypothetical protein